MSKEILHHNHSSGFRDIFTYPDDKSFIKTSLTVGRRSRLDTLPLYFYSTKALPDTLPLNSKGHSRLGNIENLYSNPLELIKMLNRDADSLILEAVILRHLEKYHVEHVPRVYCFKMGEVVANINGTEYLHRISSSCQQQIEGQTFYNYSFESEKNLISKFLAAAKVLKSIADVNIIHCDVNPDNLLIDKGGKVWVVDFNISRALQNGVAYVTEGTYPTVSPELFDPENESYFMNTKGQNRIKIASDIYSLGLSMAICAGVPTETIDEIDSGSVKKSLDEFHDVVSGLVTSGHLSPGLAGFINQQTSYDAKLRAQDYSSFIAKLEELTPEDAPN